MRWWKGDDVAKVAIASWKSKIYVLTGFTWNCWLRFLVVVDSRLEVQGCVHGMDGSYDHDSVIYIS